MKTDELIKSKLKEFENAIEDGDFYIEGAGVQYGHIRGFLESSLRDVAKTAKKEAQREIFDGLDKLGMPVRLMAILKGLIAVTAEDKTGLDAFVEKSEGISGDEEKI